VEVNTERGFGMLDGSRKDGSEGWRTRSKGWDCWRVSREEEDDDGGDDEAGTCLRSKSSW